MRIRTVFLAGFTAVAIPGLIAASWLATEVWQSWTHTVTAEAATRVVSDVQRAQTAVGLESGLMVTALLVASPDLGILEQSSQTTDKLLAAARHSADAAGFDPSAAADAESNLVALRQKLRALLLKPRAERDPEMGRTITAQRMRMGGRLVDLASSAARRVLSEAPSIATLVDVATEAMDMREYTGRRNIMMNSWVAGQPISVTELITAERLTGRVEQAWGSAQHKIDALAGATQLKQEVARQQETFQARDEPRWRRLLEWARSRAAAAPTESVPAWPEDVTAFRAWSVPAQASILALRDRALDYAMAESQALSRAAQVQVAIAVALVGAALGLSIASVMLLMRRVVSPLQAMTGSVERIAAGNLEVAVPGQERRDELGKMAAAIEALRAVSVVRRKMATEQALEHAAREERAGRVNHLLQEFEAEAADMLRAVAAAATELDATAAEMTATARDGTERAAAVANASEQASVNVQSVAASAEELSASIAEVSRQVSEGATVARHAAENARETDATVQGLAAAASRIGDVVRLISEIAGQTNLLALNATIEAARAGEAGKGFAVVASEVKDLAARTTKATEEIGAQIAAMQGETTRTVQAIASIGRTIGQIDANTSVVAAAAEQQAAATQEIGRAVARAASGTQDAALHAAGVREGAGRTGCSAAELRNASGELAKQAELMRGRVDSFLSCIRTA